RELMTNIGKHAHATTVKVGLQRVGDQIVLTVRDNGTGFDPGLVNRAVANGHIGLGSLLARFDSMGGSMRIDSETGRGTRITFKSPPEPATTSSVSAR